MLFEVPSAAREMTFKERMRWYRLRGKARRLLTAIEDTYDSMDTGRALTRALGITVHAAGGIPIGEAERKFRDTLISMRRLDGTWQEIMDEVLDQYKPIIQEHAVDGYLAHFREFTLLMVHADTREEAASRARELLKLTLEAYKDAGLEIPPPEPS